MSEWLQYIGGLIQVRIKGKYPERVVNMALARGVILTDIKKDGKDLYFTARASGFPTLKSIAEANEYELEVLKKEGLPFYRKVLKERIMLIIGAVLFVFILNFSTSFILHIRVIGNNSITSSAILTSAAKQGLYRWAYKGELNKTRIERAMLEELPLLSYIEIDIRGVNATVKVVEKVVPNEVLTGPCNIVAAKGGVIEDIIVLDGHPMVNPGDAVGAGDLLISGVVPAPPEAAVDGVVPPPRIVQARGTVKARVWYEGYGEYPLATQETKTTGRKRSELVIATPWGEHALKSDKRKFKSFRVVYWNKTINTPWGKIGYVKREYLETRVINKENDQQTAEMKAKEEAMQKLKQTMGAPEKVLSTRVSMISTPGDTIVRYVATAEVLEEISLVQPINQEDTAQLE